MTNPIRYAPSLEHAAADEAETIDALVEQFTTILDITSKDYGHGVRAVHAKGHGIVRGTFTVADGLPPELAQGLFATPGEHQAILRLSTNAGDILDDSIGLPRGAALKILGVEGNRLPGSDGDATQDFVMANGPAFAAPDAKGFLGNLKMLAKTTDKAEWAKKALATVLRGVEATLEAVGSESATLQTLGGAKQVHPLGTTYYSQTAFRYGDYVAKFSLKPTRVSEQAADTIDAHGRPDAIREAVNELMIEEGGHWDFQVQLCTDIDKMPIEDASVVWNEKASPFRTVATLVVDPQTGWEHGASDHLEDALSFAPWHGLADHQPLGGINRARRTPYQFSTDYRGRVNGCPIHEPATLEALPG